MNKFFFIVSLLVVVISAFKLIFTRANKSGDDEEGEGYNVRGLPQPIPSGFQIYAKDLPLAGSNYVRSSKFEFASSSQHSLRLEREPDNPKDSNAIRIIGCCRDGEYQIGYIPKETAKQIASSGLFDVIQPRLFSIYVGGRGDDFASIQYHLVGPRASKQKFLQATA